MTLRVCYPFIGDSVGGSHHSALALIAALGDRVEPVVLLQRDGPLVDFLSAKNLGFEILDSLPVFRERSPVADSLWQLRHLWSFARQIDARGCRIIHTNDLRCHYSWGLASRLSRARWVWHQRTANPSRRYGLTAHLATLVCHISAYTQFRFRGPRGHVIPNPIAVSPGPTQGIDSPDGIPLVCVGNLGEQKRPAFALRVLARLRELSGRDYRLLLVGPDRPPARRHLEALADGLGITEHCRFLGPIHPATGIIRDAACVLAPAVDEGHGRVLVEAQALGTPVVAADSGGHREIVDHGRDGLLVPPEDLQAWADSVVSCIDDPDLRRRLIADGRRTARRFAPSRHAAAILHLYAATLRQPHGRSTG